ncbi:hypothetical protein A8C56_00345 [Niabella ginsenosidivorans]|uniref:Uncharacterized protein n=1 Tax=Niabella ginsenosidivorans TaxID=1176587 RepID=A0A1A9IAL6_9BACT|nr:hypothetical protein [Niabella ginsenosidivorans]ANH83604.1 hypothetical protein A8C56_00345 [Niabella ginsenosidivorans]
MSTANERVYIESNCIEVQYYFKEGTHFMDALIQNKCEYELLALMREVALRLRLSIYIETVPLAEKGFCRRFKVALKKENKTAPVAVTIATATLVAAISTPLAAPVATEVQHIIEAVQQSPRICDPENEKLKPQIEKRIRQMQQSCSNLDASNIIKKRRSNFFELLSRYPKITGVQFTAVDEERLKITRENTVTRMQFEKYILTTDELEPEEVNDVEIEIIAPVLKKSNYKWVGMYNGKPRSFIMESKEFKKLVQSGKVQFKNGSVINCQLTIHKKINNEGVERITGTSITRVNHYYENDKPVETTEGKKQKKQPEPEITQLALFG